MTDDRLTDDPLSDKQWYPYTGPPDPRTHPATRRRERRKRARIGAKLLSAAYQSGSIAENRWLREQLKLARGREQARQVLAQNNAALLAINRNLFQKIVGA
jgi:hypothetical protein